jgi:hypothetical protein
MEADLGTETRHGSLFAGLFFLDLGKEIAGSVSGGRPMSLLANPAEPHAAVPTSASPSQEQSRAWWQFLVECARGLFWAMVGVGGHLVILLVALVLAVLVLISPILVLGGIVELLSRLFG